MKACVVAEYYPRPEDPSSGVWAHRQALAARDAGADVRVLVLDRPLPGARAARDALRGRPRRLGHELRAKAGRERVQTLDGIEVEYVRYLSPPRGMSYARWHRWARRPLGRALAHSTPYDLVHAHYAHLAGAAALAYTAPRSQPLVVSVHGGDVLAPSLRGDAARATIAHVLREARVALCNSRETLRRAAEFTGTGDHLRVVHLGTDIPAELPPKHERPTIATLANVDPRKRHEDVLRALERLPREFQWVVIGDGPALPRLQALTADLVLGDRVRFTGRLGPAAALDELARCHAMALPSEDEAFGVAYVEAMARAVPAIGCTGEGGPEEIAALGDGMVLVPPRDPHALAAAIERAAGDRTLGARARETAAAHFTWERCGRATVAAYEEALRS